MDICADFYSVLKPCKYSVQFYLISYLNICILLKNDNFISCLLLLFCDIIKLIKAILGVCYVIKHTGISFFSLPRHSGI